MLERLPGWLLGRRLPPVRPLRLVLLSGRLIRGGLWWLFRLPAVLRRLGLILRSGLVLASRPVPWFRPVLPSVGAGGVLRRRDRTRGTTGHGTPVTVKDRPTVPVTGDRVSGAAVIVGRGW